MDLLDEYNPSLTQQQKDQLIHDNFSKINTYAQFTGLALLLDNHSRLVQSINSATYVPINVMAGKFQSSGALTVILLNCQLALTAGAGVDPLPYLQLTVDGLEKIVSRFRIDPSDSRYKIVAPIFWVGQLPAGAHTIAVNCKTPGGTTIQVGETDADSGYYVLEFRQG